MAAGCRPGTGPRLRVPPAGVQENVTVVASAPVLDISSARVGANVSETRCRAAGERPADVAADAAGTRFAERRRRHLAGRCGSRAAPTNRTSSKYDAASKARRSSTRRQANANGEQDAVQAAGESRKRAGVPRRIEQLPAEFGTGTGGQVSVVTKSGGNMSSRRALRILRSDRMDARNRRCAPATPTTRRRPDRSPH